MEVVRALAQMCSITAFSLLAPAGCARVPPAPHEERTPRMIIPLPVSLKATPGAFPLDAGTTIAAGPGAEATGRYLAGEVEARTGHRPAISDAGGISLRLDTGLARLGNEGYTLDASPGGIAILAATDAGLFYGVQTLLQLLDQEVAAGRGAQVPSVEIEDTPRYPLRGFMLDSARHFQSVATVKRLLDQVAYLKLNTFHWHLTDDAAWRLEIKRYPKLTEFGSRRADDEPGGSGFYSQADVRELVSYARERHITIIPEIEVPAHSTAAMACFPELTCSGRHEPQGGMGLHHFLAKDGSGAIFCASREETYTFLKNVLDEVIDLFPSPYIHLGGDERPDGIWSRCPRCKALMEKEGLTSESALQGYFMRRVNAFVTARGRRSMAWCPTVEHGLPEGQVAEDWFFDLVPAITRLGHDAVNARDRYTYLDYPNFPGRQKPDWMPELTVQHMYDFNPTPNGLTPAEAKHVLGSISSLWTEFVEDDDLSESMFPRLLSFSEVVWTPAARRSWPDFERRMSAMEKPLGRMGVRYAVPAGSRPVRPPRPATVTTSMDHVEGYGPEHAFDGKCVRCFLTKTPPKAGDHLTVTLAEPAPLTRIRLYAGTDFMDGVEPTDAVLEVSPDGVTFEQVGKASGRQTDAALSGAPVRAIRLTMPKDMDHPLAVTEFMLK